MGYQLTVIKGNLGRDPQMRYLEDGTPITNLSVAVNMGKDNVTWFKVSVFGNQAENCHEYLEKGQEILVEGRLRSTDDGNPRIWTGDDGESRTSFELTSRWVDFGRKRDSAPPPDEDDEEIPF